MSLPIAHPDRLRLAPDGVTIAIPNWNHEFLLPRSVQSALRGCQALRRHGVAAEALVVDDSSRDGSLTLLRQMEALFYAEGLRVLARVENGGPAVARNTALVHARYRYVLFMDADNELIPDNVHLFYRSIRQTGAAIVYGNLLRQSPNPDETRIASNESYQGHIYLDNYIDAFGLYDRQQVLDLGGNLPGEWLQGREDWELVLHLATNGRLIVYVPLMLGVYHKLPGSMDDHATQGYQKWQPRMFRMFNQLRLRDRMPTNTRHRRYHPDIGYL